MVTACPTRLRALMVGEESSLCHWANWGKNALQLDLRSMMTCSGANLGHLPVGRYSGGRSLACPSGHLTGSYFPMSLASSSSCREG
eukprot:12505433-Alexandrium_andersonii.AAC.1